MYPRARVSESDLQKHVETALTVAGLQAQVTRRLAEASALRSSMVQPARTGPQNVVEALRALAGKIDDIAGAQPVIDTEGFPPVVTEHTSLLFVSGELQRVMQSVNAGDAAPTDNALKALSEAQQTFTSAAAKWDELKSADLPKVNSLLQQNNLAPLSLEARHE